MVIQYLYRLLLISFLLILYYKYIKTWLIRFAHHITPYLSTYYSVGILIPTSDIIGTLELLFIALSHVIFCIFLFINLRTHYIHYPGQMLLWNFSINYQVTITLFIDGILLGIGCMAVSGLLCKITIHLLRLFNKHIDCDLKNWLTMSRGGWIKHHLQLIEILPLYLSIIILCLQVGSEEIIFRYILLNYFLPFGQWIAFFTSISLFIMMQCFLMNRWQSAIFPMIGAGVMGFVHSLLYFHLPILWPLIIAHISFFLFAII